MTALVDNSFTFKSDSNILGGITRKRLSNLPPFLICLMSLFPDVGNFACQPLPFKVLSEREKEKKIAIEHFKLKSNDRGWLLFATSQIREQLQRVTFLC